MSHHLKSVLMVSVLSALFLFSGAVAWSAVIHVPGDFATIQRAIDAAQMTGDEIVVEPGTYKEAIDLLGEGGAGEYEYERGCDFGGVGMRLWGRGRRARARSLHENCITWFG